MMTAGEEYLIGLAGFPPKTFPSHFSSSATRLRLGTVLDRTELKWLYEAAFLAALCNIAINGLGGCGGRIKPEREPNRRRLEGELWRHETSFMPVPDGKRCDPWSDIRSKRSFFGYP